MGSSNLKFDELNKSAARNPEKTDKYSYFKQYSKEYLLKALQVCFDVSFIYYLVYTPYN